MARAGVVVPVIVDGVEEGVATDLGGTARHVVDVVVLEGDEVGGAVKVYAPVVIAVTGGRVGGNAVEVAVGDGHALRGGGSEDDMLATDLGGLDFCGDEISNLSLP